MKFNPLILEKIKERSIAMLELASGLDNMKKTMEDLINNGDVDNPAPDTTEILKKCQVLSDEINSMVGYDTDLKELYRLLYVSIKNEKFEESTELKNKIEKYKLDIE